MTPTSSDALVFFGATGDLAHKKIFPALQAMVKRSQPYYLDVTHPNANKGAVVRRLSELLQVPTDLIATVGDMPSDVLMFSLSGLSIAMGNASPEVQRTALWVTGSNTEDGFAEAVDKYILAGSSQPRAQWQS